MWNKKVGDITIDINVAPGIYCFESNSAIGKTHLLEVLKSTGAKLLDNSGDCLLITSTGLSEDVIVSIINEFKGSLIMLDRFDLYYSESIFNAIKQKSKCIVLMSLNQVQGLIGCLATVKIWFDERNFVVRN